jgi:hypothetical protein
MAIAPLRGVKSLLVQVCGDFARTLWAYAAALRATVVIVASGESRRRAPSAKTLRGPTLHDSS